MDLNETPEMAAFRGEVRAVLAARHDDDAAGAAKEPKALKFAILVADLE